MYRESEYIWFVYCNETLALAVWPKFFNHHNASGSHAAWPTEKTRAHTRKKTYSRAYQGHFLHARTSFCRAMLCTLLLRVYNTNWICYSVRHRTVLWHKCIWAETTCLFVCCFLRRISFFFVCHNALLMALYRCIPRAQLLC